MTSEYFEYSEGMNSRGTLKSVIGLEGQQASDGQKKVDLKYILELNWYRIGKPQELDMEGEET